MFNCGVYASAVAVRIGKTLIEVHASDPKGGPNEHWLWGTSYEDSHLVFYIDGEEVSLPAAGQNGVRLDSSHRNFINENGRFHHTENFEGTCIDDPGGQISIDIAKDNNPPSLGVTLQVARDAPTTWNEDKYSVCNVPQSQQQRWGNWEVEMVEPEKSLFTIGNKMCEACDFLGWDQFRQENLGSHVAARQTCAAAQEKDAGQITLESVCRGANIAVAAAEDACAALHDKATKFFIDCQLDYCANGGQIVAVQAVVAEEARENPQPVCVNGDCDPASKCCNALRDQATLTLDNVNQNDLCSGGELRYGSALIQNGQNIDLVVKPVGEMQCSGKMDDGKFGSKNAEIGILLVQAGTSQTFEFSFVQHGTDIAASPQNLMMTFLDIDQGKKNRQRESIEVCGDGSVITTDDTELDVSVNGNCVKVMSTAAGTGADNPGSVESMSQLQRARTVAFEVVGSSFTATLGVSRGGHNPRRFNFAGHPSVACVLK